MTPTQPIRPAGLKKGAQLLGEPYERDGQTFLLWVTTERAAWRRVGYNVVAATLPTDGFDLFEIASDSFIEGCQAKADRVFLGEKRGDGPDALVMTRRRLKAA